MRTPAPWPTNAAAYVKAITGAVPLSGASAMLLQAATPEAVAATVIAGISHLALLRATPTWLKIALSWLGTLLAAVVLGATSYEGADGLTWSSVAQWDSSDLAALAFLVMGSLVHSFVPNAPARYATVAGEVLGTVDVPDPITDPTHGDPVAFATASTVLQALTPAQVEAHRADAAAAIPAPAPAAEQLHDALDEQLVARGYSL